MIPFWIAAASSFFAGVIHHDINNIKVARYRIKNKKIKKDFSFALLTDLHGRVYGDDNSVIVSLIDSYSPDAIIIAGDMINAKFSFKLDSTVKLIERLAAKYPVYIGLGNHESRLRWEKDYALSIEELISIFEGAGALVLDNECMVLSEYGITLKGLTLERCYYRKTETHKLDSKHIKELIGYKDDNYNILIAHDPEYFDGYVKYGADMVVSGHLHGGVMRLPFKLGAISPRFKLFPKYSGGMYQLNDTKMIVSRGLGVHSIPIRVFNPAELDIIKIKKV